jgi:hypothetical protein
MNEKMRGIAWKWINSLEDLEYADDMSSFAQIWPYAIKTE